MPETFYTRSAAGGDTTMLITKQSKLLTPQQRAMLRRPIRLELRTITEMCDSGGPYVTALNHLPASGVGTTRAKAAKAFVDDVFKVWGLYQRLPKNYNGRPVGLDAEQMEGYERLAQHLRYR